jgi:DNA-binding CsgD family transcriptional regulator
MAVRLLDGGWKDDHERVEMLKLVTHPSLQSMITGVINDALQKNECLTHSRDQLFSDAEWTASEAGRAWHAAGFDHFLCSICPLAGGSYSGVRFHRRLGRPPFTARERAVVELLFPNVPWLHPGRETTGCSKGAAALSPRERQVMLLLLGGDSRKQVARKLKLSEHTVADYLKVIYRKLNVSSRAELLAKHLTGSH